MCERKKKQAAPCSKSSSISLDKVLLSVGILNLFYFALILVRSVSPTVQQFTWQRKNTFLFHCHFHLFQFCSLFHAAVFKTGDKMKFHHVIIWNKLPFYLSLCTWVSFKHCSNRVLWVVPSLLQERRVRKKCWLQSLSYIRTWNNHLTEWPIVLTTENKSHHTNGKLNSQK